MGSVSLRSGSAPCECRLLLYLLVGVSHVGTWHTPSFPTRRALFPRDRSSHSVTGACNPKDSFTRIVCGVVRLGRYCLGAPMPTTVRLAPIDWAAAVAVATPPPRAGHISFLHLATESATPFDLAISALEAEGIGLDKVSGAEMVTSLDALQASSPLYALRSLLAPSPSSGTDDAAVVEEGLQIGSVADAGATSQRPPAVGAAALRRMVQYCRSASGLIPPSEAQSSDARPLILRTVWC